MADTPSEHFPPGTIATTRSRAYGPWLLLVFLVLLHGHVYASATPAVLGRENADLAQQFLPWLKWGMAEVAHGRIPWLNPYAFAGYPFVANWQSAVFYPVNWLHWVMPTYLAVNLFFSIHTYLAGLFTWMFARRLGLADAPSMLAGAVFMASGPTYGHLFAGHMTWMAAITWFPLMLWAVNGIARFAGDGRVVAVRNGVVLAGAVGMCWLAGYPQPAYISCVCSGLYGLYLLIQHRQAAVFKAAIGISAVLLGVAMAWVQLGPGLALGPETVRSGGLPVEVAGTYSVPALNLWMCLSPNLLGDAVHSGYVGEWLLWEVWPFVGLMALCLAASQLLIRPWQAIWAILAVRTLVGVALGPDHLPFDLAFKYLPGFNNFRVPARWLMPAAMIVGVLAASTLDDILSKRKPIALWRIITPWVLAGVPLLLWSYAALTATPDGAVMKEWTYTLGQCAKGGKSTLRYEYLTPPNIAKWLEYSGRQTAIWTVFLAAGMAVLLWPGMRREPRVRVWLIGLLGLGELFLYAKAISPTFNPDLPVPEAWKQAIAASPPNSRAMIGSARWTNWGMDVGISNPWGYDPVALRRQAEFMAVTQGQDPEHASQDSFGGRYSPLLGKMWNIRLYLDLTDSMGRAAVLDDAIGEAWFASDVRVISNKSQRLAWLMDPSTDISRSVAVETAFEPAGDARGLGLVSAPLGLDRTGRDAGIEPIYRLQAESAGVLVVSRNYTRGWQYRLVPTTSKVGWWQDVIPANHTLLGVPVPARGEYVVELRYVPRTMGGPWVTAGALIVWLAMVATFRMGR